MIDHNATATSAHAGSAEREPGKTTTPAGNPHSAYVFQQIVTLVKSGHSWESAVTSALQGLSPLVEIQHLLGRGYAPDVAVRTAAELDATNWARLSQPIQKPELPF